MSRSKTMFILIGSHVVYVLSIIAWLFAFAVSIMGMGSPGATDDAMSMFIFWYVLVYPLALIITLIASWVQFTRKKYKAALIWDLIPLLWIVPAIIVGVYILIIG